MVNHWKISLFIAVVMAAGTRCDILEVSAPYKDVEGRQRNLLGGEDNVPTPEPTTSQPTGFSAPSVPKDLDLNIPLVDYSAAPSQVDAGGHHVISTPISQQEDIMRQYEKKRTDIAGSVDVNQELAAETTTAMNSVAYIFATFLCLVVVVGGIYLYKR